MPPRPRYPMPNYIRNALNERGLMDAHRARPPYQQINCIGSLCVTRAKQKATKQKRLDQMLGELENRGVYMKMNWNPKNSSS